MAKESSSSVACSSATSSAIPTSDSESTISNTVSLLDRLKCPHPSKLSQNQKVHCFKTFFFLTLMSIILSSIIGKNAKHNRWYPWELEHRIIGKILCLSLLIAQWKWWVWPMISTNVLYHFRLCSHFPPMKSETGYCQNSGSMCEIKV